MSDDRQRPPEILATLDRNPLAVWFSVAMLKSPAFAVLSKSGHLALARVYVEMAIGRHHVTHRVFQKAGIARDAVTHAIGIIARRKRERETARIVREKRQHEANGATMAATKITKPDTTLTIKPPEPVEPVLEQSHAYAATSKAARRAYSFIKAEIERTGGGETIMTQEVFRAAGFPLTTLGGALRELVAVGMLTITAGKGKRRIFSVSTKAWQAISLNEARAAAALAREKRERPTRAPSTHRVVKPKKRTVLDADHDGDDVRTAAPHALDHRPADHDRRPTITLASLARPRNPDAGT